MPDTVKPPLAVDLDQFGGQKRRSHRTPVDAPAILFSESTQPPSQNVRVLDLSLRGIGFQCANALPVGSLHRIDLHTQSMHMVSRLRVTRCTQRVGMYDIGADFVED